MERLSPRKVVSHSYAFVTRISLIGPTNPRYRHNTLRRDTFEWRQVRLQQGSVSNEHFDRYLDQRSYLIGPAVHLW